MPGQRKLQPDPGCLLDGCSQYRRGRIRVAAKQMRASMMIIEMLEIESVLLREGLRALKDREGSIKMAAMGERVREDQHRVQEQRTCSPEITDLCRIAHVLGKIG